MFQAYLFFLTLSAAPLDPSVQEAHDFQYQQRIQQLEKENAVLKHQIEQLQRQMKAQQASAPKVVIKNLPAQSSDTDAYRSALKQVQSENWQEAILAMENFVRDFPKSDLADHALFWIAQIYLQENEVRLARAELERLIELYPRGDRVSRAHVLLTELDKKLSAATGAIQAENVGPKGTAPILPDRPNMDISSQSSPDLNREGNIHEGTSSHPRTN